MTFTGLYVPLVTPFTAADEIAADALEALAHEVLDAGAAGLVALGTTGEPTTLTPAEQARVIDICATVCRERDAALIIGAGSNATLDSARTLAALDPRATAALAVVPYYNRPSEAGVVEHFRTLAAASPVPVLIYHIPYRTARTLTAETLCRLAELPNIAGFKYTAGGIDDTTIAFLSRLPAHTSILAGDDLYAAPLLALGASGAILACANVAPAAYANLVTAWRTGDLPRGRELGNRLAPLAAALFTEPNPVVVKAVLAAQGRIPTPNVRLPLLPASNEALTAVLAVLPGERATIRV
ncbi:4-hydroxy-tetrahydrodipicolinate synthase [Nocardia seriolae]|uniref:4-hydroxy-tetrahydrodipicolinate synthase n=1 Tax=Nocardia seriolae TaxID=37332 RepID=A0A0B8N101_9NOCA|nr:4-hydroxy-tetrahydrodipicolinate synthase [Nocardia seriolae]MTJ61040.1 4-hydroxy-tetrahydrodipicolinate synthase [Nocardia seriolae]MTJ70499.1 4-hydroxy-tetrahydrodipicolinate synthase [Nocardia seriolae]MTJ90828.1 4-hydroxy-tetrahydrodipicolinate synthase [Nocardia seriolae]MTK34785.1 4-hydroxy-tetrahydrodipicolinate synthase [Nocardia seriolae]MTK39019.1 4-hydroxy-tetrahydrodipicolinate synthase [Nocardia seriolae]